MLSEKEELELLQLERDKFYSQQLQQPIQLEDNNVQGTGLLGQPTNKELGGDLSTWKKAVLEGIPIAGSVLGGALGTAGGVVGGGVVDVLTPITPGLETIGGGILGYKSGSALGATLGRGLSDLLRRTETFGDKDMDIDDYVKRAAIEGATDLAFSQAFDMVAPVAKKGLNLLIGKVGNNASEKTMQYLIQNPEASLKPATIIGKQKYPSVVQQSAESALNYFKKAKSRVGNIISNIKQVAKTSEKGKQIVMSFTDEYDVVQNLISSKAFRNDDSVKSFLNILDKELGESIYEKGSKVTLKDGTKGFLPDKVKNLSLDEADKLFTRITQSDGWKDLMSKGSAEIQQGDRQVIGLVNQIKEKLYSMFDMATEGTKDYAVNRALYRQIKEAEKLIGMNSTDDITRAFAKSTQAGNETLFDVLEGMFPKSIFDKNLGTILHLTKNEWADRVGFRGYGQGSLATFITESLGGVLGTGGKLVAASRAKPTRYKLSGTAKALKGTSKTIKTTGKTLNQLLKSVTKQGILNTED